MITLGSLFDGAGTCQFAATQSGVKPNFLTEDGLTAYWR